MTPVYEDNDKRELALWRTNFSKWCLGEAASRSASPTRRNCWKRGYSGATIGHGGCSTVRPMVCCEPVHRRTSR